MIRPYIGVTDFMSRLQVENMLDYRNRNRIAAGLERNLGVGVMMSYKTLNGIDTKWSRAFPDKSEVASIFSDHPSVYNVLHYADFDAVQVGENLAKAQTFGGPNMHALQLDMCWPDPGIIQSFKEKNRAIDIILQVGTKALEMIDNDPKKLVKKLAEYRVLEGALLDKSMGKGLGMDADFLLPFVGEIYNYFQGKLRVIVAGGLGPTTFSLAEPIIREYPLVSLDAQGRLRPSGNALDPIDWSMADEYHFRASRMYATAEASYRHLEGLGRRQPLVWHSYED